MTPVMAGAPGGSAAASGGGYGSIFFFVFLFAALGTVVFGVGATTGFSLPAIRSAFGLVEDSAPSAQDAWGEVRFVDVPTRIRADRTTSSAIVGVLQPGDRVRADFEAEGWYAVFPLDADVRDMKGALGYVYAPLLKAERQGGSGSAAGT
jgi:hypothetical protein